MEQFIPRMAGAATQYTTTGTATNVAIPTLSNGKKPLFVWFYTQGITAMRPVNGAGTAPADNTLAQFNSGSVTVIDVQRFTHLRILQVTAAQQVTIAPLSNGSGFFPT